MSRSCRTLLRGTGISRHLQQFLLEGLDLSAAAVVAVADLDLRRPAEGGLARVVVPAPHRHQRGIELACDLRIRHEVVDIVGHRMPPFLRSPYHSLCLNPSLPHL